MSTLVITEQIDSELMEWWISLPIYTRERIIFEAYAKQKIDDAYER